MYLSHVIPGMDALESLFVFIWNLIHGKDIVGSDDQMSLLIETVRSAMYPLLTKEDIKSVLNQQDLNDTWKNLVQCGLINENGKILKNKTEIQSSGEGLFKEKSKFLVPNEICPQLLCLLKDIIRKGVHCPIPEELLSYVELHLEEWIQNAIGARLMTVNEDYLIDIDRSESACRSEPNVVIMDNQTGVEQYHSQWNSGLHQFLQLKHKCKLIPESLKAVFVSNVAFFRR